MKTAINDGNNIDLSTLEQTLLSIDSRCHSRTEQLTWEELLQSINNADICMILEICETYVRGNMIETENAFVNQDEGEEDEVNDDKSADIRVVLNIVATILLTLLQDDKRKPTPGNIL